MTKKLFYENAYLKEFDAEITGIKEKNGKTFICLDQSAFYPEGGGQGADTGEIILVDDNTKFIVEDVHEAEEDIWHTIDGDDVSKLTEGKKIHGKINWERRFDHMQQHSGEHIVSGIICRMFNCDNVGFHMGEEEVTIDYNVRISMEDAMKVEEEANKYIWEAHDFVQLWPTKEELEKIDYRSKKELEGNVRITSFPGADTCACCGTHVKNSAEVGLVKLVSAHNFHEGTRLELYCGKRALDFLSMNLEENKKVAVLLSTKENKTFEVVKKQQDDFLKLKAELNSMETAYLKKLSEEYKGKKDAVIISETCSATAGRNLADMVADEVSGMAAVFTKSPEEEDVYRFAICARNQDISGLVKDMNAALHGRGGGKNGFAQGTVNAKKADIENFFKDRG